MTTQAYEPHWEMHGFTGKQHLIVRVTAFLLFSGGELEGTRHVQKMHMSPTARRNDERGVDRCRSCDRSAT